jgi:hypothetical protein
MKPKLKPPGSTLLKLRHDGPLSDFAFNFNLRRCIMISMWSKFDNTTSFHRRLVGRCLLTLSNQR